MNHRPAVADVVCAKQKIAAPKSGVTADKGCHPVRLHRRLTIRFAIVDAGDRKFATNTFQVIQHGNRTPIVALFMAGNTLGIGRIDDLVRLCGGNLSEQRAYH